jgi:hypothetical protein
LFTTVSGERVHGGARALRTQTVTPASYNIIQPYCSNGGGTVGSFDVRGKTLEAWIYIASNGTPDIGIQRCSISAVAEGDAVIAQVDVDVRPDSWTRLQSRPITEQAAVAAYTIIVHCDLVSLGGSWNALVYADDLGAL